MKLAVVIVAIGCLATLASGRQARDCSTVLCSADYKPVCDSKGVSYTNECTATCSGVKKFTQCPAASQGYTIKCSEPSVSCLVDPCAKGSCPGYPKSVCLSNYCNAGKGMINGKGKPISEGPCTAIYVDSSTGKRVDCKAV